MLFSPLIVTDDGVGAYHMNRFRMYFRPRNPSLLNTPDLVIRQIARDFTSGFERYFNPNLATVRYDNKTYAADKSLRFVAFWTPVAQRFPDRYAPLLGVHDDWVVVWQKHDRGFVAQTVQRHFKTDSDLRVEAIAAALTRQYWAEKLKEFLGIPNLIDLMVYLNGFHFLAGRRSWVFGTKAYFDPGDGRIPDDVLILETAAVERYSKLCLLYPVRAAEWAFDWKGMEEAIRQIWTRLLMNFITVSGYEPVVVNAWNPSSETDGYVRYLDGDPMKAANTKELLAHPQFGHIVRVHPQIFPN